MINVLLHLIFSMVCLKVVFLDQFLFYLYTSSLGEIICKYNVNYHFYADDSQIYVSFKPTQNDAG